MDVVAEKKVDLNIDKSKWKPAKLFELAEEISERADNPGQSEYDRFVGLEHFVSGDLKVKNWGSTKDLGSSMKVFKAGDVLFARRNAYLRRASLVDFDGICSGDALVLRENHEKIVPGFLAFVLNSDALWDYANSNAAGTMSKRVKWRDLGEYEFLLPPKDQQARLAELLWAADEVVERQRALLDATLNTFSILSNKYFNKDVDKSISIGECAEVIMGQSPPGVSYNQDGIGEPLINGPTEFTERYPVKIQWTSQPTKFCSDGDILLCVRGSTTGRMNIANDKYCIGRGVAAIRGLGTITTDFLEFALRYNVDEIMRLAAGSTFPNIDSQTLKKIRIPKVSPTKQVEIISKLKELDSTQRKLSLVIESSKQLQKSLINQIF